MDAWVCRVNRPSLRGRELLRGAAGSAAGGWRLRDIVDFEEADADRAILAAQDSRVIAGAELRDDGRFSRIFRRQAGILKIEDRPVLPVVVLVQDDAIRVDQLQRWITQGA